MEGGKKGEKEREKEWEKEVFFAKEMSLHTSLHVAFLTYKYDLCNHPDITIHLPQKICSVMIFAFWNLFMYYLYCKVVNFIFANTVWEHYKVKKFCYISISQMYWLYFVILSTSSFLYSSFILLMCPSPTAQCPLRQCPEI